MRIRTRTVRALLSAVSVICTVSRVVAQEPFGQQLGTTLDPGLWWDLEDELLTEDTATLGLEVGKRLTDRLAFSAKPSVRLNGSEEFAWPIDFSLSYKLD